jgi:hypothetical protein
MQVNSSQILTEKDLLLRNVSSVIRLLTVVSARNNKAGVTSITYIWMILSLHVSKKIDWFLKILLRVDS